MRLASFLGSTAMLFARRMGLGTESIDFRMVVLYHGENMLDFQAEIELLHDFTETERAVLNEHLSSMSREELVDVVQFIKDDIKNTGKRNIPKTLQRYFAGRILQ